MYKLQGIEGLSILLYSSHLAGNWSVIGFGSGLLRWQSSFQLVVLRAQALPADRAEWSTVPLLSIESML